MDAQWPGTARFVFGRMTFAAGIVCALLGSGCQLLTLTESETPAEAAPVASAPSDLSRLLATGRWEIDPGWSLLQITTTRDESSAKEAWRWTFAVPSPPAKNGVNPTPLPELPSDFAELRQRYAWIWTPDASAEQRAELETVSRQTDSSGWTAAILLARLDTESSQTAALHDKLIEPATDPSITPALRAAAAETWCERLSRLPGDAETLFADAGHRLNDQQLAEEVRGELFRGIARRIAPRDIPGLNEIMQSPESAQQAAPLHRAAMEACVIYAWHREPRSTFAAEAWPDGLWHSRFAKDAALRKLFGRWAALANHPEALAMLKAQRMDIELSVREVAVASLGHLDSAVARDEVLAVMAKGTDSERTAAVVCLARHGGEEFQRYARDNSPRVRIAVARKLGRQPTRAGAVLLSDLLSDKSSEVQLAALAACAGDNWENHGRVSLLLQALRVGSLPTQMTALSHLRNAWGIEPAFPLSGTPEERESAVRTLAREHNVSTEVFTAFRGGEPVRPSESPIAPPDDAQRLVRQFLHGPATAEGKTVTRDDLLSLDPSAVDILEQELDRATGPQTEIVYHDVLPKIHRGYAALLALESTEPAQRRRGAKELRAFAEGQSLSVVLLRRLGKRMALEQDRQVWQETLAAILPDALPEAAQVALIALNSSWPDIRHLGCDYFERHPQPEYTAWLLPRLQDAERPIRVRAIRLLGRCGNPAALDGYRDDPGAAGLRKLLTDADVQLRWDAVLAMSTLGDAQAAQEIIRQSYDSHPRQRELGVVAMGQTGQARFVEHLVRRSWTETDAGVQQALLKSLEQLVPPDDRPGLAADSSISDKITEWARWWESRQH